MVSTEDEGGENKEGEMRFENGGRRLMLVVVGEDTVVVLVFKGCY